MKSPVRCRLSSFASVLVCYLLLTVSLYGATASTKDNLYLDVRASKPEITDKLAEKLLAESEFLQGLLAAKGYICTASLQRASYRLRIVYDLEKYGKVRMDKHDLTYIKIVLEAELLPPEQRVLSLESKSRWRLSGYRFPIPCCSFKGTVPRNDD